MPSLFRRKTTDLIEPSADEVSPSDEATDVAGQRQTPGKGRPTPKRPRAARRPVDSKPLTKEEARERRRAQRAQASEEFRREGGPRDRGPERLLARNVVDSRRNVGTWFFGGALVVLVGSAQTMPEPVRLASNLLWGALAIGLVIDSILISRKIRKLVRERFPRTDQRLGSLYFYAIMRSITFRRMRVPVPQVKIGDRV